MPLVTTKGFLMQMSKPVMAPGPWFRLLRGFMSSFLMLLGELMLTQNSWLLERVAQSVSSLGERAMLITSATLLGICQVMLQLNIFSTRFGASAARTYTLKMEFEQPATNPRLMATSDSIRIGVFLSTCELHWIGLIEFVKV
tara:strand:+ start:440 stop:865 length:426 start_codon:yes stop_codon:yes gene_type:complete